ncbi:MAG TPA: sulfite exporter TauE/SafE family protein [Vicinamibacterales bacterium]|nr:sulfite exporter TauE/SafE family protein [Vicinamibacterales bacterium]
MLVSVALTLAAGAVAGCLGALLGIGGGVFLVPFLNLVLGLPVRSAFGISLVTVIATSSVTSASPGRLRLVNLRLGMVLEIFTTTGGLIGLFLVHRFSEGTLKLFFGGVMALVAVVMISRLDRRNVIRDANIDVGLLGGRYDDPETGTQVAYRLKRVPLAFLVSFLAGVVSMLGIGGGVLKVPALNSWSGVPMRVAAATSALMIAATAVVGAINYFIRGDIIPELAAAAVLGVLAGSRAGFAIGARSNVKGLKLLMAGVLATVAAIYFFVRPR